MFLRILQPPGNRVKGKFGGAVNLRQELNRNIKRSDNDRRAKLMGGAIARNRRRTVIKNTHGTGALAGFITRNIKLRGYFGEYYYTASLTKRGKIRYDGVAYDSPIAAARAIVKRPVNGWAFWKYRNKNGDWVPLRTLRS